MGDSDQTTITVTRDVRETVKDLQDHFEEELGTRPNQGEAVAIASERVMQGGVA